VGMPRSGTTLLEQMLDRHPAISGIGEYDGVNTMGTAVLGQGVWPRELSMLDARMAASMQADYLAGAAVTRRASAQWSFDKSLHTWRWLPAVAAVLPGAACLRIERDARDTAISIFLSNFHPQAVGWTRSLESIRCVISAERALAPAALRALGIPHEDIRYEELVDRPREHMERIVARLGLPMDDAVLAPEANARTVLTLAGPLAVGNGRGISVAEPERHVLIGVHVDAVGEVHASRGAGGEDATAVGPRISLGCRVVGASAELQQAVVAKRRGVDVERQVVRAGEPGGLRPIDVDGGADERAREAARGDGLGKLVAVGGEIGQGDDDVRGCRRRNDHKRGARRDEELHDGGSGKGQEQARRNTRAVRVGTRATALIPSPPIGEPASWHQIPRMQGIVGH
ncbi:MAG: sulfotransferase, partial [Proteobacteria bacterium]|nr:sulfotransferase [Pseudomonadota bacterium]